MNENQKQYIKDVIETLSSKKVNIALLFVCGIFAMFGLAYPFLLVDMGVDVIRLPIWDVLVLIINVVSALGFVCLAIMLYISVYLRQSILYYINHLAMIPIFSIAGMVTLFILASNSNETTTLPFGISACCMMGSAVFFVFFFLNMKNRRLLKDKVYQRTKNLRSVKIGFILLMLVMIGIKMLPIPQVERYANMILMELLVIFISALIGQHLLATKLISQCREEFIEIENTPYNARLREGTRCLQRRLYIDAPIYHETALDVLEEYGLSRKKCEQAILKHQSVYTFVEGMRLDFAYLEKLLQRLRYEDISFRVEEEQNGHWTAKDAYFYDGIIAKNVHRVVKDDAKKKNEEDTPGPIASFIGWMIVLAGLLIYFVWTLIFPVNFFRPVFLMKETSIKECFKSFTYFDFRTFYHGFFIWIIILLFLSSPQLQEVYLELSGVNDFFVILIVFGIFFVAELFVFPLYLRRMEKVLEKETIQVHNYAKGIWFFIIVSFILRVWNRGLVLSLVQLTLIICAIESAKFIVIVYRYIRYRKDTPNEDVDTRYEFQEYYDTKENEYDYDEIVDSEYAPFIIEENGVHCIVSLEIGVYCRDVFEDVDVYENGYSWESIVKNILKTRLPAFQDQVSFDSEAEQFVMLCEDCIIAKAIVKEIKRCCENKEICSQLIQVIE
ncbi:Imm51 family immunity protein [Amedibacillus sp. YH-ame6]